MNQNQMIPLGIARFRFIQIEQKVSDLEKDIDAIKELIKANTDALQSILDAIERENASAN